MEEHAFAPRARLLDWFKEGWRLVPGHEYRREDWAILVYMPTYPKPVPEELMKRWAMRFERVQQPVVSNHTAAARYAATRVNAMLKARKLAALARYEAA